MSISRPTRRRLILALVFLISCSTARVSAWEADVHYGLTKWLALKAGFTPDEAEQIASGDIGVDDSWVSGPIASSLLSCRNDVSGSNVVHDHHFAGPELAPNPPGIRRVVPGEVWSKETRLPAPRGTNRSGLGQYLHTFQDSWSHQADPDVPPTCNPELAWGHSEVRGGWSCHLADLTYAWRDDVVAMAHATYDILTMRTTAQAAEWGTLVKRVEDFALRRSKWEKDAWFRTQWEKDAWFANNAGLRSLDFLQTLSVPDCREPGPCNSYGYQAVLEHAKGIGDSRSADGVPREVFDFVGQVLSTMVKQGTGTVMEFTDTGLAQQAIADGLNISEPCQTLARTVVPLMLTVGMIRGDGARQPLALCELALEKRLRGQPLSCNEALESIDLALKRPVRVGPSLDEIRRASKGPDFDYLVEPDRADGTFVGTVRFSHVMNDVLRIRVQSVNGSWRITTFAWVPRR